MAATGIAQLCALTGVTPKTLRYYEEKGVLRSFRSRSGARFFTPDQCEVAFAVILLRRLGVAIADIARVVDRHPVADARNMALQDMLEMRTSELERRLREVRQNLETSAAPGGIIVTMESSERRRAGAWREQPTRQPHPR